jgi:hypothetical protein
MQRMMSLAVRGVQGSSAAGVRTVGQGVVGHVAQAGDERDPEDDWDKTAWWWDDEWEGPTEEP